MVFSSCSDSDDDANQTKSADMVRLVSFHNELVKGMFVLTTHLDNVWENGRLRPTVATLPNCSLLAIAYKGGERLRVGDQR